MWAKEKKKRNPFSAEHMKSGLFLNSKCPSAALSHAIGGLFVKFYETLNRMSIHSSARMSVHEFYTTSCFVIAPFLNKTILQHILHTHHPKHHVWLNINSENIIYFSILFCFLLFFFFLGDLWNEVVFVVKAKNNNESNTHRNCVECGIKTVTLQAG